MIRRITTVGLRGVAPLAFAALGAGLVALAACQGGAGDAATDSVAARDTNVATPATVAATPAATVDSAAGAADAQGAMLDPNTATREQLLAVPGMPEHAVAPLVAGRPYENMVAVDRALAAHVADSAARRTVYARVWKPLDLNAATDAEILLIPGVGRRMLREFKEYRPYRSIEQFRREMGKYVDDAEVARLERYVMIR